ncbi:MAG: response regulator transcription factor [Candidatus Kapaibacteriota bacterium]
MKGDEYRVIIVDDHPLVRLGIKSLIGFYTKFNVVGEASNGLEAWNLVQTLSPDIAIIDIVMPVIDGISLVERIQNLPSKPKTLLMTAVEEFVDFNLAFNSNPDGIVLKSLPKNDFISAIESILNGKKVYSKGIFKLASMEKLFQYVSNETIYLSSIQQKIISKRLIKDPFPKIAEDLNLSITEMVSEINAILNQIDDCEVLINSTV